jgi:hypothetical protein
MACPQYPYQPPASPLANIYMASSKVPIVPASAAMQCSGICDLLGAATVVDLCISHNQ